MSTVWVDDDYIDPWEDQPETLTLWAVGPRGGRRFLFAATDDRHHDKLLDEGIVAAKSRKIFEGWNSVGVALLDSTQAELGYRSLTD